VSSFPFMNASSVGSWPGNLKVCLRRTARDVYSSNVHAVVNPRRRQPTSRYPPVHRRRADVVVRDNDRSAIEAIKYQRQNR
jgi:hypothetical protein